MTTEEFWRKGWSLLRRATVDKKHAFNTATYATVTERPGAGGRKVLTPAVRTLVLRKADSDRGALTAYTDTRSDKVSQLDLTTDSAWCFWDRKSSVQFRASGPTSVLVPEEAGTNFKQLPKHSRKAYATIAGPGTPLLSAGDGLPEDWESRPLAATDYASGNFTLLTTTILEADLLLLARDGHRRLKAIRSGATAPWNFRWVVP